VPPVLPNKPPTAGARVATPAAIPAPVPVPPPPTPAAPAVTEPLVADELEELGDEDLAPEPPAQEESVAPAPPTRRSSPAVRLPPRSTPAQAGKRSTPGAGSDSGDSRAVRKSRVAGPGEIGTLARRGMSMTHKLVLFTLLVTLPISLIFALVSLHDLKSQLMDEIKRSGTDQAMLLNAFGQRVIDRFRGVRDSGKFQQIQAEYKTPPKEAKTDPNVHPESYYPDDLKRVKLILEADKRIKDLVIFADPAGDKIPSTPILRVTDEREVAIPGSLGGDEDLKVYESRYGSETCLYFSMPLEKSGDKVYSFSSVIMSMSQIEGQVRSLQNRLIVFGLLLIGLGVGAAWGMANWFTKPINSLVSDINTVSQGDLDHTSTVPDQTSDEVGLLAMAFNRMTKNLREARKAEREHERIDSELNTAKAIHAKLMPEKLPQLPGIDVFTAYNCAKEVGGDYYDFIPVGDMEHLALCVADVSGKGIPGSMVMGTTRTILRMMAVNNLSAADVLTKTNYHVARDIKRGMFVTCIYAILNLRTREMTVASAGHNPMLIWRSATNSIEKVRPNGIALGFDKGPVFQRTVREQKVKLETGDRVLMYTDGVVESMNEKRQEWGDEKLDEFTVKNGGLPSKEFVRLLIKALEEHQGRAEQHDDITITTFRLL
jgi:serine phosphatase RsbU (regulator of sigma subunit)